MVSLPNLTPVAPIGRSKHRVLVGGKICELELNDYPKSPEAEAFREYRRGRYGLLEAARKLGITATTLSALEHGEYTCDWSEARRMLEDGGL
jgi:DNA-binding XRE family transcriptional regulator